MKLYWLLGVAVVACTRPNPAVCCLDPADCEANGFHEVRSCAAGLACVDHQCVIPSCSTEGCEAATPVCNITTDVCEGCTESSQCTRFADTDVCDTASGACVECVTAADCGADKPVCESNACRACKLDSDCPSGACGDDGACVAESAIVYMEPGGTDAGTCTRAAPCRTLAYAISQTASSRSHVVLAQGGYIEAFITISPQTTPAQNLSVHGTGATLSLQEGVEASIVTLSLPVFIRDLIVTPLSGSSFVVNSGGTLTLERVVIRDGARGVNAAGPVTLRDVTMEDVGYGVVLLEGAQLTIDRARILGGTKAISSNASTSVQIENLLVWGTSDLGLDLAMSSGTIAFSTVADVGTDSGPGPRAVACSSDLTLRASIVWAPGTAARLPIEGCNVVSTIAGPTAAPGAMNTDPLFVDSAARDYHLAANSPARDAVDTGPARDFEGDPRPGGTRFDIGADEAP